MLKSFLQTHATAARERKGIYTNYLRMNQVLVHHHVLTARAFFLLLGREKVRVAAQASAVETGGMTALHPNTLSSAAVLNTESFSAPWMTAQDEDADSCPSRGWLFPRRALPG